MIRKLFAFMLLGFLLVLPTKAIAHDEAEETVTTTSEEATTTSADSTEDLVFKMFVHEDCPHCQNVKKFIVENDLEHHVEYIELKNNQKNLDLLEKYWKDFNIDGNVGWPMMVVDEEAKKYEVGDAPIIQYLADTFDIEVDTSDTNNSGSTTDSATSAGDKIFFAIGGLFLVGVLGYAVYSALKSEDKK
ncbi:MAG: hypothetical protein Fur003_4170 [Candidatus Dojkabacteria bacterium]